MLQAAAETTVVAHMDAAPRIENGLGGSSKAHSTRKVAVAQSSAEASGAKSAQAPIDGHSVISLTHYNALPHSGGKLTSGHRHISSNAHTAAALQQAAFVSNKMHRLNGRVVSIVHNAKSHDAADVAEEHADAEADGALAVATHAEEASGAREAAGSGAGADKVRSESVSPSAGDDNLGIGAINPADARHAAEAAAVSALADPALADAFNEHSEQVPSGSGSGGGSSPSMLFTLDNSSPVGDEDSVGDDRPSDPSNSADGDGSADGSGSADGELATGSLASSLATAVVDNGSAHSSNRSAFDGSVSMGRSGASGRSPATRTASDETKSSVCAAAPGKEKAPRRATIEAEVSASNKEENSSESAEVESSGSAGSAGSAGVESSKEEDGRSDASSSDKGDVLVGDLPSETPLPPVAAGSCAGLPPTGPSAPVRPAGAPQIHATSEPAMPPAQPSAGPVGAVGHPAASLASLGSSAGAFGGLGVSGLGVSGLGVSGLGVSGLGVSGLGVGGLGLGRLAGSALGNGLLLAQYLAAEAALNNASQAAKATHSHPLGGLGGLGGSALSATALSALLASNPSLTAALAARGGLGLGGVGLSYPPLPHGHLQGDLQGAPGQPSVGGVQPEAHGWPASLGSLSHLSGRAQSAFGADASGAALPTCGQACQTTPSTAKLATAHVIGSLMQAPATTLDDPSSSVGAAVHPLPVLKAALYGSNASLAAADSLGAPHRCAPPLGAAGEIGAQIGAPSATTQLAGRYLGAFPFAAGAIAGVPTAVPPPAAPMGSDGALGGASTCHRHEASHGGGGGAYQQWPRAAPPLSREGSSSASAGPSDDVIGISAQSAACPAVCPTNGHQAGSLGTSAHESGYTAPHPPSTLPASIAASAKALSGLRAAALDEGAMSLAGAPSAASMAASANGMRVPPFLTKLYKIMQEAQPEDCCGWCADGSMFRINDPQRFADQCLPRFFKHNKLGSFQQQLLTYGFSRVPNESCLDISSVWRHPNFRAGQPQLLEQISRAAPKRSVAERDGGGRGTGNDSEMDDDREELGQMQSHLGELSKSLREMHEELRCEPLLMPTTAATHSSAATPATLTVRACAGAPTCPPRPPAPALVHSSAREYETNLIERLAERVEKRLRRSNDAAADALRDKWQRYTQKPQAPARGEEASGCARSEDVSGPVDPMPILADAASVVANQ